MAKDDIPSWAADLKSASARTDAKLDNLEKRFDQFDLRLGDTTKSLDNLSGAVSLAKWLAPTLSALVVLAAGFYIDSRAQATAEKAARQAVREELASHRKYIQSGTLSSANQEKGVKGFSFIWNMINPVNPDDLVTISASTEPPIAGTVVFAELLERGEKCRMTVHLGNGSKFDQAFSEGPVPAVVEITERIAN